MPQNTFTNGWMQSLGSNEACSHEDTLCVDDNKCCPDYFCDKRRVQRCVRDGASR